MANQHPDPEILGRFVQGDLTSRDRRRVSRHLRSGCELCKQALSFLGRDTGGRPGSGELERGEPSAEVYDYDSAFERVFARVARLERLLARERQEARGLLEELAPHPKSRQLLMVCNSRRYRTAGLCECLLQESWEARFDAPARSLDLAEIGLAVAERLNGEDYGDQLLSDLKARVWGHLGNARRVLSDLRAAEEAFAEAMHWIEHGTGSTLERARLLELTASLRSDQGRFEEAEALLERAGTIYQGEQQDHDLGRVYVNKAMVRGHLEDLEGQVELLQRGLSLVDHTREPRAVLMVIHNLIYSLNLLGRSREALALLVQWRFLYLEAGDRNILLRLQWLEGLIALNLDRLDQAEGALREVQRGFIEQGIGYDAALISLDLAALYLRQGRTPKVRSLVRDMLPIFRARDIHREAAAALIVFCQAVKRERVTTSLVSDVAGFLERARNNPSLRFESDLEV